MAQVQFFVFEGPCIGASVFLSEKGHAKEYLGISEHGVLDIPAGVKPLGFHLALIVPQKTVVVQKNVEQNKGGYHRYFLSRLDKSIEKFITYLTIDPIEVIRIGKNTWTAWHKVKPNRVDCWMLDKDGLADLFQVGVVTHDNGQSFRLLGEYRWRGRLFWAWDRMRSIVGRPDDPRWGNFDVRRSILDDPGFKKLLEGAILQPWIGKPEELDPPLDPVPGPGFARMQWYIPFAGQTGQGPVILCNGSPAWVHGIDLMINPDPDGVKRVNRNDLLSFSGTASFGKKGGVKLLCVEKVC